MAGSGIADGQGGRSGRGILGRWLRLLVGILIASGLGSEPVFAADVVSTWLGGNNNWSSLNWSNAPEVPYFPNNGNGGFTYDAVVNSGVITLDQNIALDSLTLNGGTITGARNLTLNTGLTWNSGNLAGGTTMIGPLGQLLINGMLTTPTISTGQLLINNGSALWGAGGLNSLRLSGATFQNNGQFEARTVNVGPSYDITSIGGTSFFNNAGTFMKTGAGVALVRSATGSLTFNNTGTVNVTNGTLRFNSNITQHVGNQLTGGTWRVGPGGDLDFFTGSSIAISFADVTLDGPTAIFPKINSLVDNRGHFSILNGRNFTPTVPFTNSGTLTIGTGSTFVASGGFTQTASATIRGTGKFIGNLVNPGAIRPGNSPGILEIDGNLTLTPTSVLEIEIAGLNPNVPQHDRVLVSGRAVLGGRLDVPLLGGFVPQQGDRITFLEAAEVSGEFASVFSPNLASANPNLALRVLKNFNQNAVDIVFDNPESDNGFNSFANVATWVDPETWVTGVPESVDVIEVNNLAGIDQQLVVQSDNAFAHSLVVESTSNHSITINVMNDKSLSAIAGATIGKHATIALGNDANPTERGHLVSKAVEVEGGGALVGNGRVVGDLEVGLLAWDGEATLRPGYSVGHLTVEGDYRQGAAGVLRVDVEGASRDEFDTVDVSGAAELGGVAVIDAGLLATKEPGITIEILSAQGGLGGTRFDDVVTEGAEGIYFVPSYSADSFQITSALEGDMNPSVPGLDVSDIDAFALGLMNPLRYRQQFGLSPGQACTCNGDGIFDFSDIDRFVQIMESGGVLNAQAALARALSAVPEPSAAALVGMGLLSVLLAGRQRRQGR